jgi:hypothetical protein
LALLGLYLLLRTFGLIFFEKRQHAFESLWVTAQSEVLREHAFEVLRFTVWGPYGEGGARRTYDLTRPGDVRDLLGRQESERTSDVFSRVTVEFAYRAGCADARGVADVTRELSELTFLQTHARPANVWVRFPAARYLSHLVPGGHPARRVYWTLSGPMVVTLSTSAARQYG